MIVAAWPPTSHAAGWRLQNWLISETVAVAAETASDAPSCGSLSESGVLSLGSSTSTSPIQNVKRSKNNISQLQIASLDGRSQYPAISVPTFVSYRGGHSYECQNQRAR